METPINKAKERYDRASDLMAQYDDLDPNPRFYETDEAAVLDGMASLLSDLLATAFEHKKLGPDEY